MGAYKDLQTGKRQSLHTPNNTHEMQVLPDTENSKEQLPPAYLEVDETDRMAQPNQERELDWVGRINEKLESTIELPIKKEVLSEEVLETLKKEPGQKGATVSKSSPNSWDRRTEHLVLLKQKLKNVDDCLKATRKKAKNEKLVVDEKQLIILRSDFKNFRDFQRKAWRGKLTVEPLIKPKPISEAYLNLRERFISHMESRTGEIVLTEPLPAATTFSLRTTRLILGLMISRLRSLIFKHKCQHSDLKRKGISLSEEALEAWDKVEETESDLLSQILRTCEAIKNSERKNVEVHEPGPEGDL